jgi:excisionase family DNA binding protein
MDSDTLTTTEAAERLGVTPRQIQRLVDNGTIRKVGAVGRTWLLDTHSVLALAQHGTGRGRHWHEDTAWAALQLLSGHTDVWAANTSRRWHLRNRLTHMDVEELIRAARSRARVHRYRASASFLAKLADQITRTGLSALSDRGLAQELGLAVARTDLLDGYVSREKLDDLVTRFHLVEDAHGNVTLRVFEADNDKLMKPGGIVDAALLALDLADSLDPRHRIAGSRHLAQRMADL